MAPYGYFAGILGVEAGMLEVLDRVMRERTGRADVFQSVREENEARIEGVLQNLSVTDRRAPVVRKALHEAIALHEKQLLRILSGEEGRNEFEKAASLARRIAKVGKGLFLKREYAREILEKRKPENLLRYLAVRDVAEALQKVDVLEAFSALRFVETNEWMHATFEDAYGSFGPDAFEERNIEVTVLGSEWREVAEKFVAKKHHNVSHLKEFGVIFLNPISEDIPGKFLRDFALFLHYFHEIEFYSKLFLKHLREGNFAETFKALLRGDVKEMRGVGEGEWLIVQRYLFKEDPRDPRLSLPRVNPESIHWLRGERDLGEFAKADPMVDLELWESLDWVGGMFPDGGEETVSFDLEDNAMSEVASREGKDERFTYHQKEALWTKLFSEYTGGEEAAERLLLEYFEKGIIRFEA